MSYSLAFSQAVFIVLFAASKAAQGLYDFTPTTKIAETLTIPPSTASMIIRQLNRAGLIETREGINGGIRLARPASEVTMLDILQAIEQTRPLFQTNVRINATGEKRTRVERAVVNVFDSAENAMKAQLKAVTMQDLIAGLKS